MKTIEIKEFHSFVVVWAMKVSGSPCLGTPEPNTKNDLTIVLSN